MKMVKWLIIGSLIGLMLGCSSMTVISDWDHATDFSKFKTFKFYNGEPIPGDELVKHPLILKRVQQTVGRILESKGFVRTDSDKPDMLVFVHAGIKEKLSVTDWGGYGWYDPWWGPTGGYRRMDVHQYEEGTLIIDIVDVKRKELVWRGMATDVVKGYTDPQKVQRNLDSIVERILKEFPPKMAKK